MGRFQTRRTKRALVPLAPGECPVRAFDSHSSRLNLYGLRLLALKSSYVELVQTRGGRHWLTEWFHPVASGTEMRRSCAGLRESSRNALA